MKCDCDKHVEYCDICFPPEKRRSIVKPRNGKPLTDYQIREIDELVWKELSWEEKTFGQFALKLTRAIELAHGITND